jgi:hypothetical protein
LTEKGDACMVRVCTVAALRCIKHANITQTPDFLAEEFLVFRDIPHAASTTSVLLSIPLCIQYQCLPLPLSLPASHHESSRLFFSSLFSFRQVSSRLATSIHRQTLLVHQGTHSTAFQSHPIHVWPGIRVRFTCTGTVTVA